jgi:hypothetical protein
MWKWFETTTLSFKKRRAKNIKKDNSFIFPEEKGKSKT